MNAAPEPTVCRYCGLPLTTSWKIGQPAVSPSGVAASTIEPTAVVDSSSDATQLTSNPRADAYCCFGCRFAASVAAADGEEGQNRWALTRLGLSVFFTMNVSVFTMALWSRDVYANEASVHSAAAIAMYDMLRYAGLVFSIPVLLLLGQPIVDQASQSLRRGQITMDWLLLAGVIASYAYSTLAVLTGDPHVYFEIGCVVLLAVTLGRWLEATGKLKTTQAIRALQRLLPATARVLQGETTVDVALDHVVVGSCIRVLPGERIPLDGCIERNRASVDQQLLTGESQPVLREPGDAVYAGSLNLDGDITVRVKAPASAGTLQRLVDLVTQALASKGREQQLADRITAWFVPVVTVLSLITFGLTAREAGWHAGLMEGLAVVLIACPCALGIATPMATWAALGTACREHVVFRRGESLSTLAGVRVVCFDKTGTITSGSAEVDAAWRNPQCGADNYVAIVRSLAMASEHILARSLRRYHDVEGDGVTGGSAQLLPADVQLVAGRGISGVLPEVGRVYLGSAAYMRESLQAMPEVDGRIADDESRSVAYVGWQGHVQGIYRFCEHLRPEARESLATLKAMGIEVVVLTGDHRRRGDALQQLLDVRVESELLPHDKLAAIERLRAEKGLVAMVGDGVNDAPALAAADVGIALGCGADVSREAADVCLMANDLQKIPWAIEWARRARRTIWQNLFWAFAYNIGGISLAMVGMLNPIFAAFAMIGSSLFVLSNSLRLAPANLRGANSELSAQSSTRSADAPDESLDDARYVVVSAAGGL